MKRILNTFVVICLVYLIYMIACENTYETSKSIEMQIENNQYTEFSFQSGEKAICVYEGQESFDLPKGKFAEELEVINSPEQNLLLENATEEEVLDGVMEVLKQNGYTNFRLIYDGTRDFANRNYYVVSAFDDFEDHIIRTQEFFMDMENGNVYLSDENNDFLSTELHYLGSIQYEVIDQNPYFFHKDHLYLKAHAKYDDMFHAKFVEEVVCAEMYLVKEYEQGSVYKFVVEPLGTLTDDRLNTYFYVTSDKIYRLWSYVYQNDGVTTFYDDDELLIEVFDTDEELINNGQIVCQDEEIQSEQKDGDSEFHFAINKSENQIEYSSCTITPNGEIYYYESFVWEKGKGLIAFNSGYRAEREPLYLTEIAERSGEENH